MITLIETSELIVSVSPLFVLKAQTIVASVGVFLLAKSGLDLWDSFRRTPYTMPLRLVAGLSLWLVVAAVFAM
jgi:hypothetical protein